MTVLPNSFVVSSSGNGVMEGDEMPSNGADAKLDTPPKSEALFEKTQLHGLTKNEMDLFQQLKSFIGEGVNTATAIAAVKEASRGSYPFGRADLNTATDVYFSLANEESIGGSSGSPGPVHTCAPRPTTPRTPQTYSSAVAGNNTPTTRSKTRLTGGVHTQTTQAATDVVDLTNDDDDIKKAIALSIVDTNKANREDLDMNKAIMESLKDNQHIVGFSPFGQNDPLNPHERARSGATPVGLKNIGNSCWFNVIVQTLYNIPLFREKIFGFRGESAVCVPDSTTTTDKADEDISLPDESVESDRVRLLLSMRRLFAFLVASTRAYIDPTETVHLISVLNTEMNAPPSIGIQQDATEMLLRLIEWLEDAFNSRSYASISDDNMDQNTSSSAVDGQCDATAPSPPEAFAIHNGGESGSNPLKAIFHGSHLEERVASDGSIATVTIDSSLQLVNLDVSFDNLHESLEAAWWQESTPDNPQNEQWLITVPPVVVFSLRRFAYNKQSARTEKLHNRFLFPVQFYIDRYLNRHRDLVNEKRRRAADLKRQLADVKSRLASLHEYPLGNKSASLADILRSAIRYTIGDDLTKDMADNEQVMSEPMDTSDHCNEVDICLQGVTEHCESSNSALDALNIAREDRDVFARVMLDVYKHLTTQIHELETRFTALTEALQRIYNVPPLDECAYRLHSVIIHEGEASVGHYWAYVADHATLDEQRLPVAWRKYNDKTVEPATWAQVEADAFGSRNSCSAYCLVYVRRDEMQLFDHDFIAPVNERDELVARVPGDMQNAVVMDNAKFRTEMEEWDKAHQLTSTDSTSTSSNTEEEACRLPLSDEDFKLHARTHAEIASCYFGKRFLERATASVMHKIDESKITVSDEQRDREILNEYLQITLAFFNETRDDVTTTESVDNRVLNLAAWRRLAGVPLSAPAEQRLAIEALGDCGENASMREQVQTALGSLAMSDSLFRELNIAHADFQQFIELLTFMRSLLNAIEKPIRLENECMLLKFVSMLYNRYEHLQRLAGSSSSAIPRHLPPPALFENILCFFAIRFSRAILHKVENTAVLTDGERALLTQYFRPVLVRVAKLNTPASKKARDYVEEQWKEFVSACGNENLAEVFEMILDAFEQSTVPDLPSCVLKKLNVIVPRLAGEMHESIERARKHEMHASDERAVNAMKIAIQVPVESVV